jgi:cell division septation protein DedD/nucleoid DNA-binding protein
MTGKMKTDITTAIRGLLFRYDCVIIPGFGGFICNYVPASINKAEGIFSPPARRVSFNRNLTHNDGLLVGDISSREGIGYGEAREAVEQFAVDLKRRISRGDNITFGLIGTFRTNSEGSIQFEPDSTANYNPGSYGMESFRFDPIAGYDVRKRVMRVHGEISPSRIPLRKMLVRAAVAIPVLIALIAVPLKTDFLSKKIEDASMNPLATAEFESNRKAIDEAPVIVIPAPVTVESEITATGTTEASASEATGIVEPVNDAEVKYLLIAGSFQSLENAQVMADKLRALGYTPGLMDAPNGYTRVYAGGFADFVTAGNERVKLSASVEGVWVLRK